jgi:hypothetical protein
VSGLPSLRISAIFSTAATRTMPPEADRIIALVYNIRVTVISLHLFTENHILREV